MEFKGKKTTGIFRKACLAISDIILFTLSNVLICYILSGGNINNSPYKQVLLHPAHIIIMSVIVVIINYLFRLYKSVWSFASTWEIFTCVQAVFFDSAALFLVNKLIFNIIFDYRILPVYSYAVNYIFLFFSACLPRIGYRLMRNGIKNYIIMQAPATRKLKRILIIGAGYMGNTIIDDIRLHSSRTSIPVVIADDNPAKKGKRLNGVKIAGNISQIPQLVGQYDVDEIIICIPSAGQAKINEALQIALSTGKSVKITPSIEEILENNNLKKHARKVEITDLLSRDEVKLDITVCKYLIGTTILVTGGRRVNRLRNMQSVRQV